MKKWDYKLPEPTSIWDAQKDWNQTLLTMFNQLSIGINTELLIRIPKKFKSLIETLGTYELTTNKIGNRFNVEFIETDDNIIYVGDSELEIENFN